MLLDATWRRGSGSVRRLLLDLVAVAVKASGAREPRWPAARCFGVPAGRGKPKVWWCRRVGLASPLALRGCRTRSLHRG